MVQSITQLPKERWKHQWCDHCGKRCDDTRTPFLVSSSNPGINDKVLCKACIDLGLYESNILPEEF